MRKLRRMDVHLSLQVTKTNELLRSHMWPLSCSYACLCMYYIMITGTHRAVLYMHEYTYTHVSPNKDLYLVHVGLCALAQVDTCLLYLGCSRIK